MSVICFRIRASALRRGGASLYHHQRFTARSASLLNYGAIWQSMFVPNRKGELVDVVLGYDTIEDYQKNYMFLGAT